MKFESVKNIDKYLKLLSSDLVNDLKKLSKEDFAIKMWGREVNSYFDDEHNKWRWGSFACNIDYEDFLCNIQIYGSDSQEIFVRIAGTPYGTVTTEIEDKTLASCIRELIVKDLFYPERGDSK
jgi:hypothetical protein